MVDASEASDALDALDALEAPRLVQAVRAHPCEVSCLDACGARLATGGGTALRLWEWRRGAGWTLTGEARAAHRYGVTGVRWAAGGALLASCGVDGALRVWCGRRLAARRLLAAGDAAAARALCWSGGRLLAGHDDGAVRVWAAAPALLLARLRPLDGAVHALCAPARGALLLVACTHGVLKVYDLEEVCRGSTEQGEGPMPLLVERDAHDLGALCAAASEDGAWAATGGHDGAVRVWRVWTGADGANGAGRVRRRVRGVARLEGHGAAVSALRWARGLLASGSLDRSARLWAPPRCLRVLRAHPRYLTCLALAHDLQYLITGSNDKSFRTWALRGLTPERELEPPCDGAPHFALGDLQGISPLDDDELLKLDAAPAAEGEEEEGGERAGGALLAWGGRPHAGAVNCLAARGDLLASASSDGVVKVFRLERGGALSELHELRGHQYPALCAAWGAWGAGGVGGAGGLLLSAGLDGQAVLWDAESGCRLRTLSAPTGGGSAGWGGSGGGGGDAGGGGVRGAAVSAHAPPLLLLATDDGLAPVWSLADDHPQPIHVYGAGEAAGALWCCAWGADGRGAALGGADGALRVVAPPAPHAAPRPLARTAGAHDLGITSCHFAPSAEAVGFGAGGAGGAERHVLATAGGDSLVKLWIVDIDEESEDSGACIQLVRRLAAHGGAAATASWGAGRAAALLCSAGADEWARVWSAAGSCRAAAPAAPSSQPDAGAALSAALLAPEHDDRLYLALGTLQGHVAVWRLRRGLGGGAGGRAGDQAEGGEEGALDARCWSAAGVRQWLLDYVTRVPGRAMEAAEEAAVLEAARSAGLTGARLLDDELPELIRACGFENVESDKEESLSAALASDDEDEPPRARLRRELRWLRRAPPTPSQEDAAPHALRCPLSHRLLATPARAADGLTYECRAAHDWFLAAEGAVSFVSGRRLRSARLLPNHGVRRELRRYLRGPARRPDLPGEPDPTGEPDLPGEPNQHPQPEEPEPQDESAPAEDTDTAYLLGLDYD